MRQVAGLALATALLAAPAVAEDWEVLGRGSVTMGREVQRMWIADHPDQGPQARLEGSGSAAVLSFEAVPPPTGEPYMPKPSLQVTVADPLGTPKLDTVHYRDEDGVNYVAKSGTVEAHLTEGRWIVVFSTELKELDPTTWEPAAGGSDLRVRGSFNVQPVLM
ncbi:hypothetical protein [Amorphus sp. 3PC139-8]|uniref:hypothetical protein n=1 Tax=Amorphus sp. 3PC139-8 TaxID=2735676 RepID=UPI00345D0749